MRKKVLCPRWGSCNAIKKCPLEKVIAESDFEVYVRGECANKNVAIFKSGLTPFPKE
jgi:hypothetical protein